MGELVDIFIKRDRKASGRIVLAAQGLGNRRTALFARIPCFDDRVGVRLFPVHTQSAAVHEHDDKGLASCSHSLHQVLFWFGQIETGAISAEKSWLVNRHLLAFKATRDSDHCDNNVCVPGSSNSRGVRRIVHRSPDELRFDLAIPEMAISHVELYGLSFLQMNQAEARPVARRAGYWLIIDRHTGKTIGFDSKQIIAGCVRREEPGPLNRKSGTCLGLLWNIAFIQINVGFDSGGDRSRFSLSARTRTVFRFEAGLTIWRR